MYTSSQVFLRMAYLDFLHSLIALLVHVFCVVRQALSLPITNICFSLPFLMGDDADSLSMCSLIGIVLVVIGFVTYSGGGFARNFMVAQVSVHVFYFLTCYMTTVFFTESALYNRVHQAK